MYLHVSVDFSSPSNELLDHIHVTTLAGHKQWSSTILLTDRPLEIIRKQSADGTTWAYNK